MDLDGPHSAEPMNVEEAHCPKSSPTRPCVGKDLVQVHRSAFCSSRTLAVEAEVPRLLFTVSLGLSQRVEASTLGTINLMYLPTKIFLSVERIRRLVNIHT